jgi:hypothetical protein
VSGIEPRTFWYNFRNDGDDPVYFEHNMGIMTRDLQPKPAYIAFATLARVLKGLRFAGPVDVTAPEGTFAYRFTPDPKAEGTGRAASGVASVIALWNPKESAAVTLPVSGNKAMLVNTIGEPHVLEVRNGKIEFTVPAGKTVYVQEQTRL